MLVVSDTSVLSGLIKIGHLELLEKVFAEIIIPIKVYQELKDLSQFGYDLAVVYSATWIKVKSPNNLYLVEKLSTNINLGEAEAIVLAIELKADLILMDEKLGREVAESQGLKVTGLIGILIKAKSLGLIHLIKPFLDNLIKVNFRIGKTLYDSALQLANEHD